MHDDLNDDLSDLLGNKGPVATPKQPPASYVPLEKRFEEPCPKCRGRGRFISYAGRDCGPCFNCKGVGKLSFKQSPEKRAQARASSAARRQRVEDEKLAGLVQQAAEFAAAHPAIAAWLLANNGKFEFATSLHQALAKWGSLTANQIAAVEKCIARDAARKAAAEARVASAKAIDISKIEQAFATARSNAKAIGAMGIRWLKLRLDTFQFLDAPANERFPAAILVREGDKKLGRIADGKFVRSFACDDPTEARVIAAAQDPEAAAVAYGMKYSSCSICGRELNNEESIRRGIGPICAEKFGW